MRLNKYIAQTGYCSLRVAENMIKSGKIQVNGIVCIQNIEVKGQPLVQAEGLVITRNSVPDKKTYVAFNKPEGLVCTEDKNEKNGVLDFLKFKERIFTVGRLDKDSEGLILLTNDGDAANKIIHAENAHEKEYLVTLNKALTSGFKIAQLEAGVKILDTITKSCTVIPVNDTTFRFVLTQGLNRQIRRMAEAIGYEVVKLQRTRVMNIELGDLQPGEWRDLSSTEKEILFDLL